ncbi:leucine--tRNA ligase [Candidatus Roizmanbacteria bacterium RIFCSPHIGHO2_12_FULL_36_11]|nr:MAG: leucine--tRNA ligase [Candidatus Roizmanbacteria bacterium RIFCSPHIGHO2_12_FULL_36_11]
MPKYQPEQFEKKWQEMWKQDQIFSPDLDKAKKPYFALMMFPYPSAEGLHVGNMYAFTGADIFTRYIRMQGYDVFEPIGLDGFGIHSENYAIKVNQHPSKLSKVTEERFYKQLMALGNAFDWTRTVETYKPDYYKWTQWIFLKMYENGLAYRKKAEVNWCPSCKTVLADEQVIAGKCERCSSDVVEKMLEQWFFKITNYADRLLKNLNSLDWSEKVLTAQRNWIGKKEGINITYKVIPNNRESHPSQARVPSKVKKIPYASLDFVDEITVFTTTPVNFGATFLVVAPEHPFVQNILNPESEIRNKIEIQYAKINEIKKYVEEATKKTEEQRKNEAQKKTGVFTELYAINHVSGKPIPIWISDFVLVNVGTGAIQGCPGHDYRDFDFAKKFGLPIPRVVTGANGEKTPIEKREDVVEHGGVMVNSDFLNGIPFEKAMQMTMDYFEKNGWGKRVVTYHLRDWLISRQRYWGPPIPIIYCDTCGTVPVPEIDLPVVLPYVENFRPTGTGVSPLASSEKFYKVDCPKCCQEAKRETDVSDTFLDSAWYFFRYTSTEEVDSPWMLERVKKWLPVNTYIGGAEHSVLHLLYSRFLTMVFKDLDLISHFEEPFARFRAHGLIISEGAKMSKSKGNIVNPDAYISEYGADCLRLYLMFLGPFEQGGDFRDEAISGPQNFLRRVWDLKEKIKDLAPSEEDKKWMYKAVEKVGRDISNLKFNTSIAKLMEWLNYLSRKKSVTKDEYKTLLLLLAPLAPHVTEELWSQIGEEYSIHQKPWPSFAKKSFVEEIVTIPVQVNGKVRAVISLSADQLSEKEVVGKALKEEKVKKYLEKKKYKVIYVKRKILNLVTS